MVIYPPTQRSNATFEQPNWAQDNTTEKQVSFTELPMEYEISNLDSHTIAQELSKEAVERATEVANLKFIMQAGETICAYRQVTLSQ